MNSEFDRLKKQLDHEEDTPNSSYEDWLVYKTGDLRTVDFQMLNGDRQNFNYGHHIKAWLGQEDGKTFIRVFFSTDTVTIKGFCLDSLYEDFRKLNVIAVRANDQRYHNTMNTDENEPFVTDIIIEPHAKKEKDENEG